MMRFIAVVAILLVLILAGIYAAGWMTFQSNDNSATIEIKTGEMEQAAEDAGRVEAGHAEPIHRPVGRDEGTGVAVRQERIVGDRWER